MDNTNNNQVPPLTPLPPLDPTQPKVSLGQDLTGDTTSSTGNSGTPTATTDLNAPVVPPSTGSEEPGAVGAADAGTGAETPVVPPAEPGTGVPTGSM